MKSLNAMENVSLMKYCVFLFLGLVVSACHQAKTIKLHPVKIDSTEINNYAFNKQYMEAELTEGLENGFAKTLSLTRKDDDSVYSVAFSSSPDPAHSAKNRKPCCRYKGQGTMRNDSLFVKIENVKKPAMMIITVSREESKQPVLIVNAFKEADEDVLKYFCCGGKTLAGKYTLNGPIEAE